MHGSSVLSRWQCVFHGACVPWALQLVLCPYVVASCFPLSHLLLFWWYGLIVLPARAMRLHQKPGRVLVLAARTCPAVHGL
jgi:hypothetical protein